MAKTEAVLEFLGDVTTEEYKAYLEVEKKAVDSIITACDIQLRELVSEHNFFVTAARSYYTYGVPLVIMGTYKKLRPDAIEEEMELMYFAAWIGEWLLALFFVVDDICDGTTMRAGKPSVPAELGPHNAMCLYLFISTELHNLVTKTFAEQPFLLPILEICQKHIRYMSTAMLVGLTGKKYDRMRDPKWYKVREACSCIDPAFVLPVELAFCVAQEPLDSPLGCETLKVARAIGSYARNVDDIADLVDDTLKGVLNGAYWVAWQKANEEYKTALEECTSIEPVEAAGEAILKLYKELNVRQEFKNLAVRKLEEITQLVKQSSEGVAKKTWEASIQFYLKIYNVRENRGYFTEQK